MQRLTFGPVSAPLALFWAARDWLRYLRMSEADLAAHDLDRPGIARRVMRRYFR